MGGRSDISGYNVSLRPIRTARGVHKRFYAVMQYDMVQSTRGCDAPSRTGLNTHLSWCADPTWFV